MVGYMRHCEVLCHLDSDSLQYMVLDRKDGVHTVSRMFLGMPNRKLYIADHSRIEPLKIKSAMVSLTPLSSLGNLRLVVDVRFTKVIAD